jgi:hypothetical protein
MEFPEDDLTSLELATDHFYEQPVPKRGQELASYLTRVQRVIDRLLVKSSDRKSVV